MEIQSITGVTEKMGILVTQPCHLLMVSASVPIVLEKIELSMVDFTTGKTTPIVRNEKMDLLNDIIGHVNHMNPTTLFIEIGDDANFNFSAQRVLKIDLSVLTAGTVYTIHAVDANNSKDALTIYNQLTVPQGVSVQKFPIESGEALIFPEVNFKEIKLKWSNGIEQIRTAAEMVQLRYLTTVVAPALAFVQDLNDEKLGIHVFQVEFTLTAATGYVFYIMESGRPGISQY